MHDVIRVIRGTINRAISRMSGRGFASPRSAPRFSKLMAIPALPAAVLAFHVYTVHSGDSLTAIAADKCGNSADWSGIYAANKGVIGGDPNLILPGQRLTITCTMADVQLPVQTPVQAPVQQAPAQVSSDVSTAGDGSFESCVISRESGGDAQVVNPASGAGGLFQFLPSTWADYDGYPTAESAPASVQEQYFAVVYAQQGTSPWAPYDGC